MGPTRAKLSERECTLAIIRIPGGNKWAIAPLPRHNRGERLVHVPSHIVECTAVERDLRALNWEGHHGDGGGEKRAGQAPVGRGDNKAAMA